MEEPDHKPVFVLVRTLQEKLVVLGPKIRKVSDFPAGTYWAGPIIAPEEPAP